MRQKHRLNLQNRVSMSSHSCLAHVAALLICSLLNVVWARSPARADGPATASYQLGYSEHRTNLPGGRHANVSTGQACVIRADGTERRVLTPEVNDRPDTWTQFAGWSPAGNLAIVLIASNTPENAAWEEEHQGFHLTEGWLVDSALFTLDRGELSIVSAVDRVSNYNSGMFFWPNDPQRLGFTAVIEGISHPFSMDLDGHHKQDLSTQQQGFTYGFSASPDGRRIAYHKDYQVYLADADGTNATMVTTGNSFNFAPQWSPDGAWLLFVSGEHYNCHPFVVRADGTELHKVADRNGYRGVMQFLDVPDFHGGSSDIPVWSSDGTSIYFTTQVGDCVELARTNLQGQSEILTHSSPGTLHYHPKPSPDGAWIAFGSTRNANRRQLFILRPDLSETRQVTAVDEGWAAMHAHWRPLVSAAR